MYQSIISESSVLEPRIHSNKVSMPNIIGFHRASFFVEGRQTLKNKLSFSISSFGRLVRFLIHNYVIRAQLTLNGFLREISN